MDLPIAADYPFLEVMWSMLVFFGFFLWFGLLFRACLDLFRRHDVSGWGKAGWLILMLFLPLIGVCIYLISQGKGMVSRDAESARQAEGEFGDYVREVAHDGGSAASEIGKAKALLDSGAIDTEEFNRLKAKALA